MRGLKNLGVAAVGTILLTVAASSSADHVINAIGGWAINPEPQ